MKKILAILIALLAALAVQTVAFADGEVTEIEPTTAVSEDDETTKTLNAQNKDDQGLTYTLNNDGTATVSDCDRTVTSIKIPSNVESNGQTYTVTSIGNDAFSMLLRSDQRRHSGQRHLHWRLCILSLHRPDQRRHSGRRHLHRRLCIWMAAQGLTSSHHSGRRHLHRRSVHFHRCCRPDQCRHSGQRHLHWLRCIFMSALA